MSIEVALFPNFLSPDRDKRELPTVSTVGNQHQSIKNVSVGTTEIVTGPHFLDFETSRCSVVPDGTFEFC
jgi:hypothetical protein